jgi:transcriptional regulator with XRE-family HTH domain
MTREDLGQYVSRVIKQKGITVRDVQVRSGGRISNGYVSDIMSGKQSNPTVDKLAALAIGLGVEVRELFEAAVGPPAEGEGESLETIEIDSMALVSLMDKIARNPLLGLLVQETAQLPEQEQEVILKAVRSFNEFTHTRTRSKRSA